MKYRPPYRVSLVEAYLDKNGLTVRDFVEKYNRMYARFGDVLNEYSFSRNRNGRAVPARLRCKRMAYIIGCDADVLQEQFATVYRTRVEETNAEEPSERED